MFNRALYWASGFLRAKAIKGPQGEPYLERYMLHRGRESALFLHRFLDSDPDRGLHDHPWKVSVSLILWGGYTERRLVREVGADGVERTRMIVRRMRPGMLNIIRGADCHQVVLDGPRPPWTIFWHGPRIKPWGFFVAKGGTPKVAGPYEHERYDPFMDDKPETAWEKTAPRGRDLPGRMPENHVIATFQGAPERA